MESAPRTPWLAFVIGSAALGTALRGAAVPRVVSDVDGVNFARALAAFDPLQQAPHFPGYPVYVALAKLAHAAGASETWALALPSIVLWPFAAVLLALGVDRWLGRAAASGAVLAASVAPGAVVLGGWPGSDGLGFTLLCAALGALALAASSRSEGKNSAPLIAAGALFGLLLGVRLSWWPLAAAALLLTRDRRFFAASAAAVASWLVPLAAITGPGELLALATGFGSGHFESWGNSALTSDAPLHARAARALWSVVSAGLGGAWPGEAPLSHGGTLETGLVPTVISLFAAAALVLGLARSRDRKSHVVLALAAAYALWAVLAQNVDKPRHLLPLLPLAGALAGLGLARVPRKPAALAAATILLGAAALDRANLQRTELAPAVALVASITRSSPAGRAIFAGEEARVFEHLAPMYRVMRPASASVLEAEARRLHALGVEVIVTSGTPWSKNLPLTPIATFRTREALRGPESMLVTSRYQPAPTLARAAGEAAR